MSEKIGIIADSTADFPIGLTDELDIKHAPIHIMVDGENYLDGVNISKKEVITYMKKGCDVYTTPPSPSEYADIFDNMLSQYNKVISLHVSSQFSNCYTSAKNSLNLLFADQEKNIKIIDTENVTGGQALIAKKARELFSKGIPFEAIEKNLQPFVNNSPVCFAVEDLKWLRKGGRLSTLSAVFGNILNIKPVIGLIKAELKPVGKYRGKPQAINGMIKKAVEISKQIPNGYEIWVSHVDDEKSGIFMQETLAETLKKDISEIKMVEIGSTIAVHAGPGCCGWAILPS